MNDDQRLTELREVHISYPVGEGDDIDFLLRLLDAQAERLREADEAVYWSSSYGYRGNSKCRSEAIVRHEARMREGKS